MSLIVIHHTVADNFDVDPAYSISSSGRLVAGMLVGLTTTGYVSKPSTLIRPLGILGDSVSDEYKTTAYSEQVVIAPSSRRYTSNRVSDLFNESLASSKVTVYIGSGVFATDQYDDGPGTWTVGAPLYADADGEFVDSAGSGALAQSVGYVKKAPTNYPSGVPGADTGSVNGSNSLGTYLTVFLSL